MKEGIHPAIVKIGSTLGRKFCLTKEPHETAGGALGDIVIYDRGEGFADVILGAEINSGLKCESYLDKEGLLELMIMCARALVYLNDAS